VKYLSFFSGIEAASVAFGPLGWEAVAFAEIEAFPSAVLAHRFPKVPNLGDMTKVDWSKYRGKVDLVCGGPPCQAFSIAGLRESMNDARGNISLAYVRAIHAVQPRWCLTENVPGWLSTKDNAFGCFLAGLVGADAPLLPFDRGGVGVV
jgi:DNA (cytosine-5)-methyltransferase 1